MKFTTISQAIPIKQRIRRLAVLELSSNLLFCERVESENPGESSPSRDGCPPVPISEHKFGAQIH